MIIDMLVDNTFLFSELLLFFFLAGGAGSMFSVMTALLSPRVLETLAPRRDALFATLQERAGVLCVQPSSGICLLQGEWEAMKRAHGVLEEFCLQVQAQNSMHELFRARQRQAYSHEGHNNYHKMAEEAIRGFSGPGSSPPDGESGIDSTHSDNHDTHDTNYYMSQQGAAQANHQDDSMTENGDKCFESPPVLEREQPMSLDHNGIKANKNGPLKLDGERGEDDKMPTPNNITNGEEEDEGTLHIALSEEEEEGEDNDQAENLSMRRKSQDTDGSSHSPYSPGATGEKPPMPRYGLYGASELKPDPGQLRAMAQFYAMQQNVLNYGYLAAETRKLIEARLAAGEQAIGPRFQPPGLYPPHPGMGGDKEHLRPPPYNLGSPPLMPFNNNKLERRPDSDMDGYKENLDKYSKVNGEEKMDSPPKPYGSHEWPPPPLKSYVGPYVVPSHPAQPGPNPYECPACLATFPTRDAVQEHMLQAHAVGPGLSGDNKSPVPPPQLSPSAISDAYCCPVCGKFYKSGQRLREHVLLHDKNYQRPQYPCPACGKTFTYRHNMKVHFQKIHKGKQPIKRHECNICGQKFHKPVYLRHHLLRHKEALYAGAPYSSEGPPINSALPPPIVQPMMIVPSAASTAS